MVSLPLVEKWLKDQLGESYKGMTARWDGLSLSLDNGVSQETIQTYWDGLDSESNEAQKYRTLQWFRDEKERIKTELTAKTWDQMTLIERKFVIGLEVTPLELLGE